MSVNNYNELKEHIGHKIVCVHYNYENVAIECETCNEVLLDFDEKTNNKVKKIKWW